MRATSSMAGVYTTETEDGTMSPNRLKFATQANSPSGEKLIVAGKRDNTALPTSVSVAVSNFQSCPFGVPCATLVYQ